jgi:ABC-type multidrug transport system fused ATPase/permease subunit
LSRIWRFAARHHRRLGGFVGVSVVSALLAVATPMLAGKVVDAIVRGGPAATIITLAAEITLLNLDGGWVTRAGGNQAIRTGPRGVARDWSRAIYRHHQYLQGLACSSSVWGPGRCVALWERAEDAFPATPDASRDLDDPRLAEAIADAAEQLGTYVV